MKRKRQPTATRGLEDILLEAEMDALRSLKAAAAALNALATKKKEAAVFYREYAQRFDMAAIALLKQATMALGLDDEARGPGKPGSNEMLKGKALTVRSLHLSVRAILASLDRLVEDRASGA